jgi:hypothetical protein
VLGSRPSLATAVAAVAVAVALASAWHSGGHMRRSLDSAHHLYAGYSDEQRRHAAIDQMSLPGEVFDFYKDRLIRGDRIYFQVKQSGLGQFLDLPTAVRYAGRFYLLPAVEARDLAHATVVVTFYDDPSLLHVRYLTQVQAGQQPIYVSRISLP